MIENPFLLIRAAILTCNEQVLRLGLINYLKELETQQVEFQELVQESCGGEDCDGECMEAGEQFLYDPYTVADRLFQYAIFSQAEPLDKEHSPEVVSEPEMTEEEIEDQVKLFRDLIDQISEPKEEENND